MVVLSENRSNLDIAMRGVNMKCESVMKYACANVAVRYSTQHSTTDSGSASHASQPFHVNFLRTLRVENPEAPIPLGFGSFPVFPVSAFRSRAPSNWVDSLSGDDNYFIPMYPQEAMCINFPLGYLSQTLAVKVTVSGTNAVTGKKSSNDIGTSGLESKDLDSLVMPDTYLVAPPQRSFGTWKSSGKTSQFVSDHEDPIEVRLAFYAPVNGGALRPNRTDPTVSQNLSGNAHVHADPFGIDVWQRQPLSVITVYLCTDRDFLQLTGSSAMPTPVNLAMYERAGVPWPVR